MGHLGRHICFQGLLNLTSCFSYHIPAISPPLQSITFRWRQDKSVIEIKQEEHSSIHHYITYSAVSAEPALTYSSVYSTIRVYPITSGPLEDATFVEWSATFSGDADASVIQVCLRNECLLLCYCPRWYLDLTHTMSSFCAELYYRMHATNAKKDWQISQKLLEVLRNIEAIWKVISVLLKCTGVDSASTSACRIAVECPVTPEKPSLRCFIDSWFASFWAFSCYFWCIEYTSWERMLRQWTSGIPPCQSGTSLHGRKHVRASTH